PSPTYIHTLSLHDALPILRIFVAERAPAGDHPRAAAIASHAPSSASITPAWVSGHSLADTRSITSVTTPSHTPAHTSAAPAFTEDRKSTRLNSSHVAISYA